MEKKHTTMRFTAADLEAIATIRERYGCLSDSAAVRLALHMVARGETAPVAQAPNKERRFYPRS